MSRPTEYENLIKANAFDEVAPTPGAIAGFLRNAADYKVTADELDSARHLQVFTLAYEGYFQVVQAILEFYEVRTKDAGRNLAIQRVSASLGVSPQEFAFITKAHERRNGTSYVSPFPPVSKAEAATMLSILTKYLPVAHTLTGTS
ncbi:MULTISPECIES: hypothetical protein [Burkholderia]|uniref:hypothetical protein n=1 Tax=Burkholderia TaxID=32008 RepID=UPI000B7A1BB3|nr:MULTISPECIES: hypothetical protein [Burkholderia]MBY4722263.1 hypothetical protein [Burkholderia contaminans]MCI3971345.1 hypothetical protein [Burkholderia sp. HI4860]MDN7786497.1 hypothetical protein [Burkholderia contaminans]OXJ03942.1 hypothetical protein CFB48_03905 [Burkholderia sp. AU33647]